MQFSPKATKDIFITSIFVFAGTCAGIIFSSIRAGALSVLTVAIGGLVGFLISFLCAVGNNNILPRFKQLPFSVYLLIKTLYFTGVTVAVLSARFLLLGDVLGRIPDKTRILMIATLITMIISLLANLMIMFRRILGQNTILNLLTGRYHKPVEEERIFMFLDIASSTSIAEKIGHKKFHLFLNEFFYDITDPVLTAGGEIYKYVGDEVIIIWDIPDGVKNSRCLLSYFEIVRTVKENKSKYLDKFEFLPHCRAGIHSGKVTVGEMGDFKREIAFLGDTVNTTARIQEACKEYNKDLLVSSDLLNKLSFSGGYKVESLGEVKLRGKAKPTELFSVEKL